MMFSGLMESPFKKTKKKDLKGIVLKKKLARRIHEL
jgi:hypothetical protein